MYIYMAQTLSIVLGLVSLFIVMPYLTSNKEVYGIYSICLSLTVFFSYADLGFVSSAQKFASEAYIQGEKNKEIEVIGFSGFILLIFMTLICVVIFIFAFDPGLLIKDISPDNIEIARKLLLILGFSSFIYCFQRLIQMVYIVRLSDYVCQTFAIIGSALKISSVFVFFGNGKYDIVGYFLCFQIINFIVLLLSLIFARARYKVSLRSILKNLRFKRSAYDLLSKLAFAGLFVTICWVFYYELDTIFISKIWGASTVAIYSVAFSVLSMFRSLFGALYSPFIARFNYFIGLNDNKGLAEFLKYVIEFYFPITIIPILAVFFCAEPFVISWLGDNYVDSIILVKFFVAGIILTFISSPAGLYITAIQRVRVLYINSLIIVITYWGGILVFKDVMGVTIFAIMKAIAFILSAIYISIVVFGLLKESLGAYLWHLIKRYTVPLCVSVFMFYKGNELMFYTYSRPSLFYNMGIMALMCVLSFFIFLPFSRHLMERSKEVLSMIKIRKR